MTRREQLEKNLELASVGHGIKDEFISVPLELQAHVWAELRALWAVEREYEEAARCMVNEDGDLMETPALDEYHGGQS